jgi:hypothetical protein
MKVHTDELAMARAYSGSHDLEYLDREQISRIMVQGRELHQWFRTHPRLHAAISFSVIGSIFAVDWIVWVALARWFVAAVPGTWALVFAAILLGVAHSLHIYWISIYSLHEGAAHNLIFPGKGAFSKVARFFANNMCRLAAGDPEYYSECHMAHHAGFGTEDDSEFLNFIFPRRLWLSFLPLASFFNYTDFFVHRPLTYTRSRVISACIAATYNGLYLFMLYHFFGLLFALIVALLMPHVGFYLDRLRQYTEHNLMPLERNSGARSLGVGFWGMLVGGGPWGQPCHLAHHMVASLPWYQQILLHRRIVGQLTEAQRKQFLLKPVVGFPILLWAIVRESRRFSRDAMGRVSVAGD